MKKMLILACLGASFLILACKDKDDAVLSDTQIGLRKSDVASENISLPEANFTTLAPGEAQVIDRSFENAPPLIPHSTDGLVPITKDNNMCLSCHDKAIAKDVGATPMPETHYFNFYTNKSTGDVISDTRFVCTSCHVPQSNAKPLVRNTFKPVFDSEELKKKSDLIDTINEGVK